MALHTTSSGIRQSKITKELVLAGLEGKGLIRNGKMSPSVLTAFGL